MKKGTGKFFATKKLLSIYSSCSRKLVAHACALITPKGP